MKHQKWLTLLVIGISVMAIIASLGGFGEWFTEIGNKTMISVRGETVILDGRGLYANDSISVAAQGRASDLVVLVLGIPVLLGSLQSARKGSFKGQLILTGILGFFLYTYMSYCFLWMFNPFFLVYVALMAMSLQAFILSISTFDLSDLIDKFEAALPIRLVGGFQIFLSAIIALMWIGKIVPATITGQIPQGLEHYTTLVIQAMDLGIVVPAAMLSGISIIRRKPIGYLLSAIILIKGIAMLTTISAMIINMAIAGVQMNWTEAIIFLTLNLFTFIVLFSFMKNIKKTPNLE